MKVIIVTGTPGTGKTTVAKKLAKELDYKYLDVSELIKSKKISKEHDEEKDCDVVDVDDLNKVLEQEIKNRKKGLVIDSHMSHFLPNKLVDLCVVTTCDLKELYKRLKKRGYNEEKIRDNVDCEIFEVCLNEAREARHNVIDINTSDVALKENKLREIVENEI